MAKAERQIFLNKKDTSDGEDFPYHVFYDVTGLKNLNLEDFRSNAAIGRHDIIFVFSSGSRLHAHSWPLVNVGFKLAALKETDPSKEPREIHVGELEPTCTESELENLLRCIYFDPVSSGITCKEWMEKVVDNPASISLGADFKKWLLPKQSNVKGKAVTRRLLNG